MIDPEKVEAVYAALQDDGVVSTEAKTQVGRTAIVTAFLARLAEAGYVVMRSDAIVKHPGEEGHPATTLRRIAGDMEEEAQDAPNNRVDV